MIVTNNLPEPTTIHWHGLQVPNDQDGASSMTQRPSGPGEVYTYSFTIPPFPAPTGTTPTSCPTAGKRSASTIR